MTKDEAIQRLRDNETLYMGDAWIGWNESKQKYEHYEFGRDWHSEKLFATVDELIEWIGNEEEDYHLYQTSEEVDAEVVAELKAVWGEDYTWASRLEKMKAEAKQ